MVDNNITILHLSDMQFGIHHRFGAKDTEIDSLLNRLHDDLQGLENDYALKPDLIILSGDLTEWGKKPEFTDLLAFVSELSQKLEIPRKRVIMIPGNHDINRTKCKHYFEACEEEGDTPREPYWQKWEYFKRFFDEFYTGVPNIQFTEKEPYSLFEIEELKIVVAGLNSTMKESHRDEDHYGYIGEEQLKWFRDKLELYKKEGWLRIATVHHNVQRGAEYDNENLKDADDLKRLLKDSVNLVLHGHTHQANLGWLTQKAAIIATGSAGLKEEVRPNDVPNQYQIIQLHAQGLTRYCRAFIAPQKEWRWDNHVHKCPETPFNKEEIAFENINSTFSYNGEFPTPTEEQTTDLISIAEEDSLINSNNIPQPRDFFTGRTEELQRFSDILTRANLVTIEGLGGIGKTEFAAEYIKQSLSVNNVVWFDCETSDTLDALIAQIGYTDILKGENKTDLAKYSGFVNLIERDQSYLFLDNFQEASDPQFIEFFKFAERKLKQAKLILISREHPKISGILIAGFRLDGLGKYALDYAQAIQQRCYPQAQVESQALAEICKDLHGHPLAIEFAIQLLDYGEPYQNISQKIVEYKEDSQELSHRLLAEVFKHPSSTEAEKQLLCQFSIFRGKVSKEAITVINDNQNPMPVLSRLINKLMISVSEQKFHTHPLIREFCYQKLDNPKPLHQKAAVFFQQSIRDTFSLPLIEQAFYHLSKAQNWQGVNLLIQKYAEPLLLSGHYQFLQQMMQQPAQHDISAVEFNLYYGTIAQVKGEWQQALDSFKEVFTSNLVNEKIVLDALNRYGEMCWRRGDYQDALSYFEQSYQRNTNTDKAKADALHGIGLVYRDLGDLNKAEKKYQASLNIRQDIGDKKGIAISLHDLALILDEQGNQDVAMEKIELSLELRKEIGDKEGIARSFGIIGGILSDKNNLPEALKKYKQSLEIRQEIGDKKGIASSLVGIGNIFIRQGNIIGALKKYEESLKIYQEIEDKNGIASSLNGIGITLRIQGNLTKALKKYQQALNILKETDYKKGIADTLVNIGVWYGSQKTYFLEVSHYTHALALQNKIGSKVNAKITEKNIIKVRQVMKLKKFKALLEKSFSQLPEDLKPYFDITVFTQDSTVKKRLEKIKPNVPCPCGSGKKYKKCCALIPQLDF